MNENGSELNRNSELELKPGTILKSNEGEYTIIRVLGRGGFGITYLAHRKITVGNIVVSVNFAIKEHFISSLCARDASTSRVSFYGPIADTVISSRQSFIREASRIHELGIKHPNIVRINEVFEANNTAYYVMEYLEGETLEDYVERKGALSVDEASSLLRPIAEAVAEVHRNHLTHYDIKPQNIILARNSDGNMRPVLIDFGLAKHYDKEGKATSTLSTGGYSTGYAPIEQYTGLHEFTPQADVYSLAATLYYCLTGLTPSDAASFDIKEATKELQNRRIPESMIYGITHAMQILRQQRPADAAAFIAETFDGLQSIETVNKKTDSLSTENQELARRTQVKNFKTEVEDTTVGRTTQIKTSDSVERINSSVSRKKRKTKRYNRLAITIGASALVILIAIIAFMNLRTGNNISNDKENLLALEDATAKSVEMIDTVQPSVSSDKETVTAEETTEISSRRKYDDIYDFSEGMAVIKLNGLYGYINSNYEEIVPPIYQNATNFSEGLASVEKHNIYGYIDKTGKVVLPFQYTHAGEFHDGLAGVTMHDGPHRYIFINKKGEKAIPFTYDGGGMFLDGLAIVKKGDKWGFIDKSGNEVIPVIYDFVSPFSEGLAGVEIEGKWGFIDKKGNEVIPPKFDYAYGFRNGISSVIINGVDRKIDRSGNFID